MGSIAPEDRKLLWWGGAVAALLVAATFALSPSANSDTSTTPSTYSSGSGGARAAYLLLLDLGYDVRRWEQPPAGLETLSESAVLILADPTETPTDGECASLLRFVESGGRIVFSGAALSKFFPRIELPERRTGAQWTEFSSSLPSPYTRDAAKVILQPEAYAPGDAPYPQLTLYGGEAGRAIVLWHIGKGQVLWWAGPTPLTNGGIRQADNLNLFLNSVTSASLPDSPHEKPAIYWDEYFHGQRGSFWTYFQNTPVIWGGVQLLLLSLALLFTFSRRSGPITSPAAVSRLSPLEFVNTMAGLYQRAGAAPVAVGVTYRHLRLELAHRLGVPAATPDPELAQAASDRLGQDANELGDVLHKAALAADSKKLPAREALALVQSLQRFTIRLMGSKPPGSQPRSISRSTQEKI